MLMIGAGLLLLALSFAADLHVLPVLGIGFLFVGIVLFPFGAADHAAGGQRWWL